MTFLITGFGYKVIANKTISMMALLRKYLLTSPPKSGLREAIFHYLAKRACGESSRVGEGKFTICASLIMTLLVEIYSDRSNHSKSCLFFIMDAIDRVWASE